MGFAGSGTLGAPLRDKGDTACLDSELMINFLGIGFQLYMQTKEQNMRRFIIVALIIAAAAAIPCGSLWAADGDTVLVKNSAAKPVMNGKLSDKEYTNTVSLENGSVRFALNKGTLSFGVSFETNGWVAIGFGSGAMDGASIVMCYVDANGAPHFSEQTGVGHSHAVSGKSLLLAKAAAETGTSTTMEGQVKLSGLIGKGEKNLSLIIAYGSKDSFTSFHKYYTWVDLVFE
jgi:hypothetical protein